ncbi:unnamed protein product [Prunus armeniaca]
MSCTRGSVPFKSTVHGPNSEAEPQICDSPNLPLHALLLNCFRLLSYATPRSSPPINWAPERNENENAAGPTHCRHHTARLKPWLIYFQALQANGCDHTNSHAPDPIRTPKLSEFGRE